LLQEYAEENEKLKSMLQKSETREQEVQADTIVKLLGVSGMADVSMRIQELIRIEQCTSSASDDQERLIKQL
jgi:hypothetical protein